ncbi:putative RNA-directed DNA polymerase from transposon X-element [Trichonephila inaurata madagascariensis]|uniref:Putative RNA-directed DNA polymerase from transposon X-element n=1 Tax=Trichonephila inaurata madagascariensis TaxID=2747483 RepID=A0A8X6YME5_9ARAC|nr:putative RNA-directed DNA polymerase from transposon X-element [Trichonephila inaurata madagascariensis]
MLRFVKNAKKKREFREIGDLTVHEIEHAEETLIKIVQAKFFPSEDLFPNMNVIADEEGIKRVKTRITVSGPIVRELRLGEIVLIGDDIKKRINWPLAKVFRLIPGKDGKIRTVELKARTGIMLRPIQRAYPLEVQSTETPDDPLNDCTFTNPISSISSDILSDPNDSSSVLPRVFRHGRVIQAPEKLDLFDKALYVFEID